ncbi:type IV secretory system conjugative DNA transfer family protein [Terrarubrum flagellatum]
MLQARHDEQFVFIAGAPPIRMGRAIYFRRPEMRAACKGNRFVKDAPK